MCAYTGYMQKLFWTKSGARLQRVRQEKTSSLNWIFLPGGPGLGSESLARLTSILQSKRLALSGNFWQLDLPGDGSNTTSNNTQSFQRWSVALIEAIEEFKDVILVAHSTGGMYALSTPKLESLLKGLILLDSAPDEEYIELFSQELIKKPLPHLEMLQIKYQKNPNNQTLKEMTIATAPYLFTQKGLKNGIEMLQHLPYNYETCQWSEKNFDQTYKAKWIPKKIPTLILAGECDLITPLHLFTKAKDFARDNIVIKSIKNAGHFPWIDNPKEVIHTFQEFYNTFYC